MTKAIIFDLDGTLIDSAIVILRILNRMRRERHWGELAMQDVRPHLSKGGLRLVSESLGEAALDAHEDLDLFRRYYAEADQGVDIVFDMVPELLGGLMNQGYRLGVCTNKPQRLCDQALNQTGLESYFTAVVTAGEKLPSKPDPSAYLKCCEELDVLPRDTILVGDSEVDRDTARACGAQFILVTYGYPIGDIDAITAAAKCDTPLEVTQGIQRIFQPSYDETSFELTAGE